ncbi:ABC transporter permease [Paenibacillus sp. F411]|uniref:ABC transporter permease n=1 Tax=Paenibacillus sp. F411 TaxID=2820239 RepID=UPI0032658780
MARLSKAGVMNKHQPEDFLSLRAASAMASREIKLGFRSAWAYSFMALFVLLSLALLLIQQQSSGGYTGTTGAVMNLILYLLPLMALLLGSFSIAAEREEGGWQLLSTYPISTCGYVTGKFAGTLAVLLIIVAAGFGLSGLVSFLVTQTYTFSTYILFLTFSACLIVSFLSLSLLIGALSSNRWQALTLSVAVWFLLVLGWPTLIIAVLGMLPYLWIKPVLMTLVFLNPAELSRLFLVIKLGGGAVLGPEYYKWVGLMAQPEGTLIFLSVSTVWMVLLLGLSAWIMQRRRTHV